MTRRDGGPASGWRRLAQVFGVALALAALVLGCAPRDETGGRAPAGEPVPTAGAESPAAAGGQSEIAAAPDDPAAAFAAEIEQAHGVAAWRAKPAFQTDLVVRFGDKVVLDARMTFPTDLSRSRLKLADGTVAVFDGQQAWVAPGTAGLERARFHLLTWPYFTAAPFKLRDPGSRLELLGDRELAAGSGKRYPSAKLTFEDGVGDTPDDWYRIYRDPETGLLAALAYVVTYGRPQSEAEAEPHAITYRDPVTVEGVELATVWTFWHWSETEGIYGEPIGDARLNAPRFVEPAADAFDRPEGSRLAPLPGGEEGS
jgi:hypothetical protein